MSGEQKVVFYNISHGRNRKLNENIYGNFLSCLPILIDTDRRQTVKALLAQTKSQMFISMRNKVYPLYHKRRYHYTESSKKGKIALNCIISKLSLVFCAINRIFAAEKD